MVGNLYAQWSNALQQVGIKPLSDDTCCRLMAVVYVFGGNSEAFTHNLKLLTDVKYAQRRLNLLGGETPDKDLVPLLQSYIKECEQTERNAPYREDGSYAYDKDMDNFWAVKFMKERYNITLI